MTGTIKNHLLEQRAELIWSNADCSQDAAERTFWHILASVDWHRDGSSVWMAHHVVAAASPSDGEAELLQSLNYLCSRHRRNAARHKAGNYQGSGNVEGQRQLVWYPHFFDEKLQARAQVGDCLFARRSVAERGYAGTQLGRGAPDAVFVLLDGVGHVNDASHGVSITCLYNTSC